MTENPSTKPVVIRVKRKESGSDHPVQALRIVAKRPRLESGVANEKPNVFFYVDTVRSPNPTDIEAAVSKAISKKKLDRCAKFANLQFGVYPAERTILKKSKGGSYVAKMAVPSSASSSGDSPSKISGKCKRKRDEDVPDSAQPSASKLSKFRIIDLEKISEQSLPGNSEVVSCNGQPLVKVEEVYDVYYGYPKSLFVDPLFKSDGSLTGACSSSLMQADDDDGDDAYLTCLIESLEEEYRSFNCLSGDMEDDACVEDDSDSNSESNWRNDYPDSDDVDQDEDEKVSYQGILKQDVFMGHSKPYTKLADFGDLDSDDSSDVAAELESYFGRACDLVDEVVSSPSVSDYEEGQIRDINDEELIDWESFKRQLVSQANKSNSEID